MFLASEYISFLNRRCSVEASSVSFSISVNFASRWKSKS